MFKMTMEAGTDDERRFGTDAHLPKAPSDVWDVACYGDPIVEANDGQLPHETSPNAPMPSAVQLAVLFECASVALQGVDVVVANQMQLGGWFELRVAYFVVVASGVGVLLFFVATRRGWARILLLNLVIIAGFVLLPVVIFAITARSPAGLAAIALYLLHVAGVALLFHPRNREWFAES